jgi:hypothetical protein
MSNAPKLLTEYISTDSIVRGGNTRVKPLPLTTECPNPSCAAPNTFTVYQDHTSNGGEAIWGFCTKCGATGDVVELYMQKLGAITPADAIDDILENGFGDFGNLSTDTLFLSYELHRQVRESVSQFWRKAKENLKTPSTHPVLSRLGLEHNHSLRFVGSANTEEIYETFRVKITAPGNLLVVPFQDLPGRICRIRFYFVRGNEIKYKDIQTDYSEEAGVFMLDAARPNSEIVVAIDDPLFALQVQNHLMMADTMARPVIAYANSTPNWSPIVTGNTVFWTTSFSMNLFKVAEKAPGSKVSLAPPAIDRLRHMRRVSTKEWTTELLTRAMPWTNALGAWLCTISREEASPILQAMDLTPTQRQEIINQTTGDDDRRKMKNMVEAAIKCRTTMCNNIEVVEREGSWYSRRSAGKRETLISDTTIRLTGTVRLVGAGNYYTGFISRRGNKKKFYAPVDMKERENKKWLDDFCLEHGLQCPEIAQGWGTRLFAIARSFAGELENETRVGKVGWSPDLLKFYLPSRVVDEGRIERDIGVPVVDYPCQQVTGSTVSTDTLKALLENNKANAQFWALFSCVMMNTTAPYFGIRKKKIGVVGQGGFSNAFSNSMDLRTEKAKKDMSKVPNMQHDVPVHLEYSKPTLVEIAPWLNNPEEKNVIMGFDYLEAFQLAEEDWVFVTARDFGKINEMPIARDLIPYAVQFVQTTKLKVSAYTPDIFLTLFRKHLYKRFLSGRKMDFSVMDEANKLISNGTPLGTTPGQALLYGIFLLMREGSVKYTRKERANAVVIGNKQVTIPHSVIKQVVIDGGTQRVGDRLVEESANFSLDYSSWVISSNYWEHAHKQFQQEGIF